jgi:hypothetical protein
VIDEARRDQETAASRRTLKAIPGLRDARIGRQDNIARCARVRFIARIHL